MLNAMLKARNKKGFTLMEMLIVVAIIAILMAIAIPTFAAQLNKARLAADHANIRNAYALMQAAVLTNSLDGSDLVAGDYYFQPNGTLSKAETAKSTAYTLQGTESTCNVKVVSTITGTMHTKGYVIKVVFTAGTESTDATGILTLVTAA